MVKWLARTGLLLVVLLVLVYIGDWMVLCVRLSRGTAYRVIEVNQFLASPLKGNKVEYDWMGTVEQRCSKSLFPQAGSPACWWLKRHATQWE
jgi:hypothetical protein